MKNEEKRSTLMERFHFTKPEIIEMWKEAKKHPHLAGKSDDFQRQELCLFLILYENENNNVEINLRVGEARRAVWEDYIEALKRFSRMEPDVNLYLQLAEIAQSPYSVSITKEPDGVRYYFIKAK